MVVIDEELLVEFRAARRCELCRRATPNGTDPHHCFSRGAGRIDHAFNLISLCRDCHCRIHGGGLARERLLEIVAAREGTTVEAIREEIWRLRREPKGSTA